MSRLHVFWTITGLFVVFFSTLNSGFTQEPRSVNTPSKGAREALRNFQYPDQFQVETYASEPLLKNPVSFTFDRKGRVYVAETHRWKKGVNDNRNNWYWLMDDLASRTTQDRLEKFKKWAKKGKQPMSFYKKFSEKIRRLVDTDGDGVAERSNRFAGGFNGPLEGPAAGLLFYRGELLLTCIPYLWKLRDRDGDGVVDDREKVLSGFGVRSSYLGHDLHGLALGPDGRIYFSIGDRGYNVKTSDGRRLTDPMEEGGRGAVFRCEPDGSNLEVYHRGLRNPQELAFDRFGNLFTGDNDPDLRSLPRLVYVVEGGDSGWTMGYQYMERWDAYNALGAWGEEKLYRTYFDGQPEWIVPPLYHLGEGPAGLVHYPGTGFPESYDHQFFLCDFKGSPKKSGVRTFSLKRDGASFEVTSDKKFLWGIAATDVDFGYDGKMYVSDWVSGWDMPGKGRIYTVFDPDVQQHQTVREVPNLFAEGFGTQSVETLTSLLSHPDQRVRLRSHLALARRGTEKARTSLRRVALNKERRLVTRLHGIWGLGVIARRRAPEALQPLEPLLRSEHPEIRSQVLRVMGEARYEGAVEQMIDQLSNGTIRVRYFAAQALSDIKWSDALKPVIELVRTKTEHRPYLQHACVQYLTEVRTDRLMQYASDPSEEVRTAVVLALRGKRNPLVSRFLRDSSTSVAAEAARAIYDLNIDEAMPKLAALLNGQNQFVRTNGQDGVQIDRKALLRRSICANFRLRTAEHLRTVGRFAAEKRVQKELRIQAIDLLSSWAEPKPIDPILGRYLSLKNVDEQVVRNELEKLLPKLLASSTGDLQSDVTELASRYGLEADQQFFVRTIKNSNRTPASRASALSYLSEQGYKNLSEVIDAALASKEPRVRIRAREVLVERNKKRAFKELRTALENGNLREKQAAFEMLGNLKFEKVDELLAKQMEQLMRDEVPEGIKLDLLQAVRKRSDQSVQRKLKRYEENHTDDDPLAEYMVVLHGGDPKRGEQVFRTHSGAQCMRCHKVNGKGGTAGPDLSDIGKRKDRTYILESLLFPDENLARGYKMVTLQLEGGKTVSGTVNSETEEMVTIATPAGEVVRVQKSRIKVRNEISKSSMPSMKGLLTKKELRDVVSYLASLDGKSN